MRETELEMVMRHVESGEQAVARQCGVIRTLRELGHDSRVAEELLVMFRHTLASHYEHLERLQPTATGPVAQKRDRNG